MPLSVLSRAMIAFLTLPFKTLQCLGTPKHLTTVMLCLCTSGFDCDYLTVVLHCVHYPGILLIF